MQNWRDKAKQGFEKGWKAGGGKDRARPPAEAKGPAPTSSVHPPSSPLEDGQPSPKTSRRGVLILLVVGVSALVAVAHFTAGPSPKSLIDTAVTKATQIAVKPAEASDQNDNPLHLPPLPQAARFSGYLPGEPLRPAQDALNAGDVGRAYNLFAARDANKDGALERKFDAAIEVAFQQWSKSDPGGDFADRAEHYWIPATQKLARPTDDGGWAKLLIDINEMATNFAGCEGLDFSTDQKATVHRFARVLGDRQRELFPAIRQHLAKQMDAALFRNDTRVSTSGAGAEVLRFTGPQYARNAAIADMEEAAGSDFQKSRFRRVEYRWSHYFNDGSHYDLNAPKDGTIAVWDDTEAKLRTVKCNLE